MKNAVKKARQMTERREDLIHGTIKSIAAVGFNESTVVSICEAAGLSRGLIGYYFKGKDELLLEAYRYLAEQESEEGRQAAEAAGADALLQLLKTIEFFFQRIRRGSEESLVMLACRGVAPWNTDMREVTRSFWRQYRIWVETTMSRAAAERNRSIDAKGAAITFAQLCDGLWMGWIQDPEAYSLDEAEAIVRRWLLDLMGEAEEAV
jgi:TetR/AcrR family transcriptional repressor of bet genes